MKKFILVLFLLVLNTRLFAQIYSQFNTGSLYDSFENPAQKAFIPDSSRKIAFNLFIPNLNTNFFVTGNVQAALKSRAFTGHYDDDALKIGQGKLNRLNVNFSAYSIMLKLYTNLSGDQEMGFFAKTRAEGRGIFTDDDLQMFSDYTAYTGNEYSNLFDTHFFYQAYHQIGFTYRENVTKDIAFGVKLSGLLGIAYNKVNINSSHIIFDKPNDQAFISLAGNYYNSFEPGNFTEHDLLPTFKNPGASITLGATYRTPSAVNLQWNIKDLGFIHWNKKSIAGNFDNTGLIEDLSGTDREDHITNTVSSLMQNNTTHQSFTTPTNSLFEFSASKIYWLNYDRTVKYTPTVILSKELFYTGFTGILVNHVQYKNFIATVTGSYNDLKLFNLGGQLMIKSPNAEVFIGSERLFQTKSTLQGLISQNNNQIDKVGNSSAADFFLGFSFKFGAVVEHRANASVIPMGEQGFFGRLWSRFFSSNKNY